MRLLVVAALAAGLLGAVSAPAGRRAKSVVDTLVKNYKIPAAQMTSVGVGPAAPVATNDTEEGQAKNRRVELVKM